MRTAWIYVALALAISAPANAETNAALAPSMTDCDMPVRLNAERLEAYRTRDRSALDRILAEDFVAVRGGGSAQTTASIIEATMSPGREIRRVAWDNVQIFVRGDMAFVAGRSILEGTQDGRDISGANQYADVYMRRSGQWKPVAARIAGATGPANPR